MPSNHIYQRWLASGTTLPLQSWAKRNQRTQANGTMRRIGVTLPIAHHIHYVHLTAIPVPHTIRSLSTLTREADRCWIRSLRTAKALVEVDRAQGGHGSVTTFEFQRCLVCERLMLGQEASDYRERRRWPAYKCYWPWGPCCSATCKPDEKRAAEAIANGQTRMQRNREEWSA